MIKKIIIFLFVFVFLISVIAPSCALAGGNGLAPDIDSGPTLAVGVITVVAFIAIAYHFKDDNTLNFKPVQKDITPDGKIVLFRF